MQIYSACKYAKRSDVLIALEGIVHDVAPYLENHFVAGLWKKRFADGLCW